MRRFESELNNNGITIASVIERNVGFGPNKLAVVDDRGRYTYVDVSALATSVARSLIALGVEPGGRVACLMRNRFEWVVSCVATAQIGAVFVPINTWYRRGELAWTLLHTGCSVFLSESEFLGHDYHDDLRTVEPAITTAAAGELKGTALPNLRSIVYLERAHPGAFGWQEFLELGRHVGHAELDQRRAAKSGGDPFLILYTSGSTGRPKGVVLPEGAQLQNGIGIGSRRGIVAEDAIWLGSPLFYGLGSANCLPVALTAGATLVLQDRFDPEHTMSLIEREQCSTFYGMSNMIRQLYEAPNYHPGRLASLSKGTCGIQQAERRLLLTEMGVAGATASYGATEVCGNCFGGYPDDSLELKLDTCGKLLPGFEAKIVDRDTGFSLKRGEVGILNVRGHTAIGYLQSPIETGQVFGQDGFYSTGDLGSLDSDGYFRWTGRIKEMIKTGGINVAPVEIEYLLLEHPSVHEAYVVGIADSDRGEAAVAFVVADDGISEADIKKYVRTLAASFKVPASVLFRKSKEIPRTASGKVDKLTLATEAGGGVIAS